MKIGFYAGSFDPFTNGHLQVIQKSAQLFDKVVVGIGVHSMKTRRFDKNKMKEAIEKVLIREKLDNVTVIAYNNLSVDVAKEHQATFLIRGIRNGIDYQEEEKIAAINEEISGLDTVYVRAGSLGNLSSSMVMKLLNNQKDVSKYLPPEVKAVIEQKE